MDHPASQDVLDDDKTDEDRKVDAWAVLVVFVALVLGAVHFVSGWTFHF
jgi:hypothetical protein